MMDKEGDFRISQDLHEYTVQEFRNGSWMIIESLPSRTEAVQAFDEYAKDGHTIKWRAYLPLEPNGRW